MSGFNEKSFIEDYLIEKLPENGCNFTPAVDIERESYTEPLLLNHLVRAAKRLNTDKRIGEEDIKHTMNELKLKGQELKVSSSFSTSLNSLCL